MTTTDFSLLDAFLIALATGIAVVMLRPGVRNAPFWRATVTPLASIIGSGFLVVVPLLAGVAGPLSVVAIAAVVALSFWIGDAIRFTMRHNESLGLAGTTTAPALERLSDLALAAAYVISITFYIRLMSGFVLTGLDVYSPFNADVLATAVLLFIGLYGWRRGLGGLERLEEYSVTIKLAIIASLLAGLLYHDASQGYGLNGLPLPSSGLWDGLRELAGMLLIVQGFETSKYLSSAYSAPMRCRSMTFAQILAGIIYVAFVALAMPMMPQFVGMAPSETAIIDLSRNITLALPVMLVIAAAMSQFSAAIADTIGAGGVAEEESRGHVPARVSYLGIALLAVALIWNSNIFQVVALASRAFAFYYMLQAISAAVLAARVCDGRRRQWLMLGYSSQALLLLLIVLFALPIEG